MSLSLKIDISLFVSISVCWYLVKSEICPWLFFKQNLTILKTSGICDGISKILLKPSGADFYPLDLAI